MTDQNAYQSPQSAAKPDNLEGYVNTRPFTTQGRLNRIQYIAYSMGLTLFLYIVGAMIATLMIGVAGPSDVGLMVGSIIGLAMYIAIIVMMLIWTVRRCHDFDKTGWLAILLLIPFVGMIFWFVPGTQGNNRFGGQPPKASLLLTIVAALLPIFFIVGILAAIGIPAYQDYTVRAQVGECFTTVSALKSDVAEHYQVQGRFFTQEEVVALPNQGTVQGRYCDSEIDVDREAVVSTMKFDNVGAPVRGSEILFTVDIEKVMETRRFVFDCYSENIDDRYLPSSCSGTASPY